MPERLDCQVSNYGSCLKYIYTINSSTITVVYYIFSSSNSQNSLPIISQGLSALPCVPYVVVVSIFNLHQEKEDVRCV